MTTMTTMMTDAEKIEALQEYIMSGTDVQALQEIAKLSLGNPCDPLHAINKIATEAIQRLLA